MALVVMGERDGGGEAAEAGADYEDFEGEGVGSWSGFRGGTLVGDVAVAVGMLVICRICWWGRSWWFGYMILKSVRLSS